MSDPDKRARRAERSKERIARRESIKADDTILRYIGGVSLAGGALVLTQVGYQMTQSADRLNIFELGIGGALTYLGARVLWEVREMNKNQSTQDNIIPVDFARSDSPSPEAQPPSSE